MTAVISRIVLRYIAGALVTAGYLDMDTGSTLATDPDVLMLVGIGIGVLTEFAYTMAHRLGWSK